jgi:hypothetical protein
MFWGCGIAGNLGGSGFASICVESLRMSALLVSSSLLRDESARPDSVGVSMSW